jgi:hypothetical protein
MDREIAIDCRRRQFFQVGHGRPVAKPKAPRPSNFDATTQRRDEAAIMNHRRKDAKTRMAWKTVATSSRRRVEI